MSSCNNRYCRREPPTTSRNMSRSRISPSRDPPLKSPSASRHVIHALDPPLLHFEISTTPTRIVPRVKASPLDSAKSRLSVPVRDGVYIRTTIRPLSRIPPPLPRLPLFPLCVCLKTLTSIHHSLLCACVAQVAPHSVPKVDKSVLC